LSAALFVEALSNGPPAVPAAASLFSFSLGIAKMPIVYLRVNE
jgi:hypothetical protein